MERKTFNENFKEKYFTEESISEEYLPDDIQLKKKKEKIIRQMKKHRKIDVIQNLSHLP